MKMTLLTFITLALVATQAMAASQSSVERGKVLFNDTALGTNGKSCASCHPGGKGLESAATYDTKQLEKVANQCITKALKGKSFASDSPDLKALISYMQTLGSH